MPSGQRQKQSSEISAHIEWSDSGDSFWIHLVFLPSFCDIQGMLHWNSFQSYFFDPWSGCCSGLPGTLWLCRWSAKWVVVAGFGVWRTSCDQLIGRVCKHRDRITTSNVCGNISGDIAGVSWLHLVMSVCFVFASKFFGFEATGRPKDSGPLSPCPALTGDAVASTAEVPKAPPNAAYRLISMLESAAWVLEAMRVLNVNFMRFYVWSLLPVLEILQEIRCNQQQNEFTWIYGQKSKNVKIRCDSQWYVRLRLNRFITQVPSGASLSPSWEAPAVSHLESLNQQCSTVFLLLNHLINTETFPWTSLNLFLSFCCLSALTTILDCAYPALPGGLLGTPWNFGMLTPASLAGVSPACNLPPTFPRVQRGRDSVKFQGFEFLRFWFHCSCPASVKSARRSNTPACYLCMTMYDHKKVRIEQPNSLMYWSAKFRFRWDFAIFSHVQLEILRCWLRQDVRLRHAAKVHQPGCSGMFKEVEEVLQWFDWIAIDSMDNDYS